MLNSMLTILSDLFTIVSRNFFTASIYLKMLSNVFCAVDEMFCNINNNEMKIPNLYQNVYISDDAWRIEDLSQF